LLDLAHEALTSPKRIRIASIVVRFWSIRSREGFHIDPRIEQIAALYRFIFDNHSRWGGAHDLQGGCNILRTALMILSWCLRLILLIDGLMGAFVRAADSIQYVVAVL
jgi:hypothetical protein